MASQEYRRIVKHWADWKLFHLKGDLFQLCQYDDHNQEYYHTIITAGDDDAAIKQCVAIVKKIDRKKVS